MIRFSHPEIPDVQVLKPYFPLAPVWQLIVAKVYTLPKIVMNTRNQVVCLFTMAFLIRVVYILTLEDRLYWPDEEVFDNIAMSLLKGTGYKSSLYRANPILPFFLGVIYKLFGHNYLAARLIQSLIGAITVVIVYAVSDKLFNRRVALLSGLVMTFYPPLIYICGVLIVTCLFTFLIALNVYLLILISRFKDAPPLRLLALSGVALGITVLCRPVFLVFIPLAATFVIFSCKGTAQRRTTYGIVLVLIAFLTVLPWTMRNYVRYDRFVLVSTGKGLNLWRGNNELSEGDSDDRHLHPGFGKTWKERLREHDPIMSGLLAEKYSKVRSDLEVLDEVGRDAYLQRLALLLMKEHPARSLCLFLRKIKTLYLPFTDVHDENIQKIGSRERVFFSLIFLPILLLGVLGIVYSLKEWHKYLILYLILISITVTYALMTACTRFRIPIDPYVLVFASYTVIVGIDSIRNRKHE